MPNPTIDTTPEGTTVNGSFYKNQGNSDSAFPSAPPTSPVIVTGSGPAKDFANHTQFINNQIQTKSAYVPPAPTATPTAGAVPAGWDPQTYANFKAANPGLEPTPEDTAKMNAAGGSATTGKTQTGAPSTDTYSDAYTQQLDKIAATSDKATQNLIATIKASRANQGRDINEQYDRLKSGLFSLGVSTGQINFTPELVYGKVNAAENTRLAKLQDIDQKEATALIDAQQASEDKDLSLLKEKRTYIDSLKQTRLDLLKKSYDTLSAESGIAKLEATSIYDAMQPLNADQRAKYLQAVSQKYDVPLITLQAALNAEQASRQKKAKSTSGNTSGKNYTATNIPDTVLGDLTYDLKNKTDKTVQDFYAAYPEVSTTYLNSLYNTYHPKSKSGVSLSDF